MSPRSRTSPSKSPHSTSSRDRALRRLSLSTRWLIAGSVALTGALSEVAAHAFPGKTVKIGAHGAAKSRRPAHHSPHGSASSLAPPAQAPRAVQRTPETHGEAAPARPAEPVPERSSEPVPEAAPEAHSEPAPEAHAEPTPEAHSEPAPEVRSEPTPEPVPAAPEGPVVSGGS